MELEKLKQFKEFISAYDIIDKAYKLCENNDYYYLRHDGITIYLDEWDDKEKQYNCESYTINSDIKEWY